VPYIFRDTIFILVGKCFAINGATDRNF